MKNAVPVVRPVIPNPEGPLPPLPEPIPDPTPDSTPDPADAFLPLPRPELPVVPFPPIRFVRSLRHGCYLLRYTPKAVGPFPGLLHFDGTMRVERAFANTTASGDLYLHRAGFWPVPGVWPPLPPAEPNPAAGVPIFPIARYRYYLRVTRILERFTFANSFTLGFNRHRFDQASGTWTDEGAFTAQMAWTAAPAGYPSGADYLTGEVKDATGTVVGSLTMGWVSPFLRRATIEIDRVNAAEAALDNGAGAGWRDLFAAIGWDLTVDLSDLNLAEPSGEGWSDAEMHATMLARRDSADLDREWRYHLICVRRLDSTERGIMYDAFGGDSNAIPREGAGLSSHWTIPNADPWGLVKGLRFGAATKPYFRTAVHEIGHAMGLYHNTIDNGFMHTTPDIAANAVAPVQFPDNIEWRYAPDDQKRLKHMPDIWVRPGGIAFGNPYAGAPISPDDLREPAAGLTLRVEPLLEAVPIGAPVRVSFVLENTTDRPLPVPANLGLKGGFVKGQVIDPSGTVRRFWPLVRCVDSDELRELAPDDRIEDAMTLLRGPQGALFPAPGIYTVVVEVDWAVHGYPVGLRGETTLMVTTAVDDEHAAAARRVLSAPDALLTLVLGGDHLPEGIAAIQAGLDNPTLRPHYAYVEAKRLGKRFGKRKANPRAAVTLLDESSVMSEPEREKATGLFERAGQDQRAADRTKAKDGAEDGAKVAAAVAEPAG